VKVGGELGRRDCQLPPGDAHHAPSGSFEAPVAGSVVLEGVRCVVVVPAVELDYHAPDRPDAVDLRSVDEDVGLWLREAGTQEELLEALLELAAHDAEAAPGLLDDSFDDRDSRFPRVALNELGERQAVGEPELLGLPQRAAPLAALNDGAEVEQGARQRGDRDAVMDGHLIGRQVRPVELNPLSRCPAAPRHRDLHPASSPDPPECRGGTMAEDSPGSTGEHRRQPAPVSTEETRSDDRVDTAVHLA